MQERRKPLGMKNYGHIAHLPGSRMGPGDHSCELGQARIATLKARDRHDHVIVQEKLSTPTMLTYPLADAIPIDEPTTIALLRD